MITVRRHVQRQHVQSDGRDTWLTFHPGARQLPPANAGVLTSLDEIRIPPGGGSAQFPAEEAELVTYVHQGALIQEDSTGYSGVVYAGEFQHVITGSGVRHKEANVSRSGWVHLFRIGLRPPEVGLERSHEQRRFAAAERHNRLRVTASPDGRKRSLRIHQDALVFSSVVDPGHHLIHELLPGRSAWLHVVHGEVTLPGIVLARGDGAGISLEPAVSLTARESTEILLIDTAANASW